MDGGQLGRRVHGRRPQHQKVDRQQALRDDALHHLRPDASHEGLLLPRVHAVREGEDRVDVDRDPAAALLQVRLDLLLEQALPAQRWVRLGDEGLLLHAAGGAAVDDAGAAARGDGLRGRHCAPGGIFAVLLHTQHPVLHPDLVHEAGQDVGDALLNPLLAQRRLLPPRRDVERLAQQRAVLVHRHKIIQREVSELSRGRRGLGRGRRGLEVRLHGQQPPHRGHSREHPPPTSHPTPRARRRKSRCAARSA